MKFYFHPGRSWSCFIVSFKIYSTNLEVGPRSISVITTWRAAAAAGWVCFRSICSQNPICAGLEMMNHMYRQHCKQRRLIKTHFTWHRVAPDAKWKKGLRHSRRSPRSCCMKTDESLSWHVGNILPSGSAEQHGANGADENTITGSECGAAVERWVHDRCVRSSGTKTKEVLRRVGLNSDKHFLIDRLSSHSFTAIYRLSPWKKKSGTST